MTTTPEPLIWTPGDGLEALIAIRDAVKTAQDAGLEMERMTAVWDDDDATVTREGRPLICNGQLDVGAGTVVRNGGPHTSLTRVEWTPPADPDPAWADADVIVEVTDAGDVVDVRQQMGGGWCTPGSPSIWETQDLIDRYRRVTTPVPLIRDGRVCAEAILALGVDDHSALCDPAWVHSTVGRSVWDWLGGLGGDR